MKTIILLFASLCFLSCSGDDPQPTNQNPIEEIPNPIESTLHPPTWTHGTWRLFMDDVNTGMGYTFTEDDWCSTVGANTSCWKSILEMPGQTTTATEEISGSDYIVTITTPNNTTNVYHFRKVSDSKIQAVVINGTGPTYNKVE